MDTDPQMDVNVGTGHPAGANPMDDAVAATLRTLGGEAPSADVIAAAKARAAEMLQEMNAPDSGLKDMQNLTLSIGLPTARAAFLYMIRAANIRGAAKAKAIAAISDFSPVTEVGCMKVDFFNTTTGKKDIAYLVLDECPKHHNLGRQLDRMKEHVADDAWPKIVKHLSMLIHIGRSVYGNVARKNLTLIRSIFGLAEDDPCEKYLDFQIDRENTTLFLDAEWPTRAGIYLRLEADLEAERANDAK
jgi:hypothetical protein